MDTTYSPFPFIDDGAGPFVVDDDSDPDAPIPYRVTEPPPDTLAESYGVDISYRGAPAPEAAS